MAFFQTPPALGNQLDDDRPLRSYLRRTLPPDVLREVTPSLRAMGELAGGALYAMQQEDRKNEPTLTSWDAWGQRVDRIEVSPLWREAARLAAEHGVVASAYERAHGPFSRVFQFALTYLFGPSTDVYICPLAMTDGAAKTLLSHGNGPLIERAVSRLTSRDPALAWTSGQWMTERTGGSDVGLTETLARPMDDGSGRFRLHGTKWFTSATTSPMALTLARPEGNPPGGRGLALFYVEVDDASGRKNGILVNRLKDKLGTRKVPTAELTLDGAIATPVAGLSDGVRNIAPMLNITRTWNAVGAVSFMRRGLALARDYAKRRIAFGAPLSQKPLHAGTLAVLAAEHEAALHLAFHAVELLGREEAGTASAHDLSLARLVTPLAKLLTGKQVVAVVSEVLECFGGAGYVEDTGLPLLLRDAQVLPIWEGTTNVLSLDALRAIAKDGGLDGLRAEIDALTKDLPAGPLGELGQAARVSVHAAAEWLATTYPKDALDVEAGARSFALSLARTLALARLASHAAWAASAEGDPRPGYAAAIFAQQGIRMAQIPSRAAAYALANDDGSSS
jgi:acyl-CoA dehydrogenase